MKFIFTRIEKACTLTLPGDCCPFGIFLEFPKVSAREDGQKELSDLARNTFQKLRYTNH